MSGPPVRRVYTLRDRNLWGIVASDHRCKRARGVGSLEELTTHEGDLHPVHAGRGITASISRHTLRHFLFTWLQTQGIDDPLIEPLKRPRPPPSLKIYSRLALADAQQRYDVVSDFSV
jgi:hypothetical protein